MRRWGWSGWLSTVHMSSPWQHAGKKREKKPTCLAFQRYPGGEKINRLRIRCPHCHISSPLTLNSALLRTADHLRGDQTLLSLQPLPYTALISSFTRCCTWITFGLSDGWSCLRDAMPRQLCYNRCCHSWHKLKSPLLNRLRIQTLSDSLSVPYLVFLELVSHPPHSFSASMTTCMKDRLSVVQ